jgi:hypothetical protein
LFDLVRRLFPAATKGQFRGMDSIVVNDGEPPLVCGLGARTSIVPKLDNMLELRNVIADKETLFFVPNLCPMEWIS